MTELSNRLRVRHNNCPTASPSSQGKMFCTLLHDACVAEELEYREKPFFFSPPTVSPGGKLIPSGHTERGKQSSKQSDAILPRYTSNQTVRWTRSC